MITEAVGLEYILKNYRNSRFLLIVSYWGKQCKISKKLKTVFLVYDDPFLSFGSYGVSYTNEDRLLGSLGSGFGGGGL